MKKGQTGVTLIILMIATLFIGAIVAGVYIKAQSDFQSKTKEVGDNTRKNAAAIFFVMDIIGTGGADGDVEEFQQLIKLPPGSDPVDMETLSVVLNTESSTASLTYAGTDAALTAGVGGFNTWTAEELGEVGDYYDPITSSFGVGGTTLAIDLDLDGVADTVAVCDDASPCSPATEGRYLKFNLSTAGFILTPIEDENGGSISILAKNGEQYATYLEPIGDYGYVSIFGVEAAGPLTMEANAVTVFLTPTLLTEDLDGDNEQDLLTINDTHVQVYYSTNGDVYAQLNTTAGNAYSFGGADLSGGAQALNANITLTEEDANPNYGSILIQGTTTRASYIDDSVTFTVTPYALNKGTFAASYVKRSVDYEAGVIHDGDMLRLYYETPESIDEDEEVMVTILTRGGGVTRTEFLMPNIINSDSLMIYPST